MLKIRFIVVDRTRSPFLKEGESYYLERLRKYARVEWIGVDDPYDIENLEAIEWNGKRILVPPLEMQLEEDMQRGLAERVEKIERHLMNQRG